MRAHRRQIPKTLQGGEPAGGARSRPVFDDSANEDRSLVERARFGDERAFERLVGKYYDRTVHIARNFVGDGEAARDVAQESFLRVYRCLDRYDPRYRFYTWYYRLVVHMAIDWVRRHRKLLKGRPIQPLTERAVEGHGHEEVAGRAVEQAELRSRVEVILERVPLKYRQLLVLRDIEGFTSKEIAEIADWNHATVRWRLHRARKLFRAAWEEAGYPEDF